MTNKVYVLDTSVLIANPSAMLHFTDCTVLIPIIVLNELDNLKKHSDDVGKNARVAIRKIDEISDKGDISTGVLIDSTLVKVDATYYDISNPIFAGFGNPTYGDTQILACAYFNHLENHSDEVVLVSNDINLRIKAKSRGMDAIAYKGENAQFNDLYSGVKTIVNGQLGLDIQAKGFIDPTSYDLELNPNECVAFTNDDNDTIAMARKVAPDKLKLIKKHYPWGLSAKNKEQQFAIDMIMDKSIDLVTLTGSAGTGKTICALAAALELVLSRKEYDKLIIYRPIVPVGADIGYIPGTVEEKLAPWFQAIMDNFEVLFSSKGNKDWRRNLEMYQKKGIIEMNAITYIRGRSIPNAIILLDESQNINKNDIKSILTRSGENSKFLLVGDVSQQDLHSLDPTNNGLTYVIDKFKSDELAGHITFINGERSRLATKAAEIL
jgi:PhoH-like ATPase